MVTLPFRPGMVGLGVAALSQPMANISPSVLDLAMSAVIPTDLPGTFLPLYRFLYGLLLKKGKIDISRTTTKAIVLFGALAGLKAIWMWGRQYFFKAVTSSVRIPQYNKMYKILENHIVKGVGEQTSKHVALNSWQRVQDARPSALASAALEVEPVKNSGSFRYQGRKIFFEYKKTQELEVMTLLKENNVYSAFKKYFDGGQYQTQPVTHLEISSFGSSREFLLGFLKSLADNEDARSQTHTTIWTSNGDGAFRETKRPNRPIFTIDLDKSVKDTLINDVMRFVTPEREKWYASCGIPYRRGYLFYGPPGTGKSSTAVALAALLKGDVYIANMASIKDEKALNNTFALPRKGDILLLEDIDSAGIQREDMQNGKSKGNKITLSSVLNAIDGGSAREGVILIMTSNNPESLDAALIRPGRVDLQVLFSEVTQAVAQSIFIRMYQGYGSAEAGAGNISPELLEQAKTFSSKFPENKITPAEVQGFLMTHATPDAAIINVGKWIERIVLTKTAGKKIVGDYSKTEQDVEGGPIDDVQEGHDEYRNKTEHVAQQNATPDIQAEHSDDRHPENSDSNISEYGDDVCSEASEWETSETEPIQVEDPDEGPQDSSIPSLEDGRGYYWIEREQMLTGWGDAEAEEEQRELESYPEEQWGIAACNYRDMIPRDPVMPEDNHDGHSEKSDNPEESQEADPNGTGTE